MLKNTAIKLILIHKIKKNECVLFTKFSCYVSTESLILISLFADEILVRFVGHLPKVVHASFTGFSGWQRTSEE